MTREEVFANFEVDKYGFILSFGLYAGAPIWAPYFNQKVRLGRYDYKTGSTYICTVTNADREEFPELKDVLEIIVSTDEITGVIQCTPVLHFSYYHVQRLLTLVGKLGQLAGATPPNRKKAKKILEAIHQISKTMLDGLRS